MNKINIHKYRYILWCLFLVYVLTRTLALQAGVNGYLTKPIKIDEMLKVIGSML